MIRNYRLIAATVALGLIAGGCGEANPDQPQGGEVLITIGGVASGDLATKTDGDAVATIIKTTAPTGTPTLSLQSTTNAARSYTVTPGVPVNLPYDTYTVTGRYVPSKRGDTMRGAVYAEPRYKVAATIEVVPDKGEYSVPAEYECFALVIDYATTKRYTHLTSNMDTVDFTLFATSGDMGIAYIFVSSEWGQYRNRITAYPTDEAEHEATEYALVTNRNYDGYYVQNGKWYCFSPAAVETESGALGIELPEWEAGQL